MDNLFHKLAKFLNGMHWFIGITTLPESAGPKEERSFVLMWLGVVVFGLAFLGVFLYWLLK
jgi:hypothetical protein